MLRNFKCFGETRLAEVEGHLFWHGIRLGMRSEIALTREGWVHIGPPPVPGIVEDRPARWKGERRTTAPTPIEAEFLRASTVAYFGSHHAFFSTHWDRAREAFRVGRFGEEELNWFLDLYHEMDQKIAEYDEDRGQSESAYD